MRPTGDDFRRHEDGSLMATHTIPVPPGFTETDAGRVESFLTARGVAVTGVAIRQDAERRPVAVIVEATTDPTAAVLAYVPTPTPAEAARAALEAELAAALAKVQAKAKDKRTDAELLAEAVARLIQAGR
jgi:hypothetical protein